MYILLLIIVIIICVLLGAIVLIQNPKGGGLTSNFSSQSQLMGVQKTGDFLEKGTWVLAISLMALSLIINIMVKNGESKDDSQYESQKKKSIQLPASTSSAPAAAPLKFPAPAQQAPAKK